MGGVGQHWATRTVFLRALGAVYFVAFLSSHHQLPGLVGSRGLLPGDQFLSRVTQHFAAREEEGERQGRASTRALSVDPRVTRNAFLGAPTVLLFWKQASALVSEATGSPGPSFDDWLRILTSSGLALSVLALTGAVSHALVFFLLWAVYFSIVSVGQTFFNFGWESQLLETGFLAIFMAPVSTTSLRDRRSPPPRAVIWLLRWLIFRIMLGAGLIKLRSNDSCWVEFRCMDYFYETQPIPNPVSAAMHAMPSWFHTVSVGANHFVEIALPVLHLSPWRDPRAASGLILIAFMGILVLSGNLSFLNWLTMLPAIACFDDEHLASLASVLPRPLGPAMVSWIDGLAPGDAASSAPARRFTSVRGLARLLKHGSLACAITYLSALGPVPNLVSSAQVMNTSFDPLRIVNTYGAFGTVSRERQEVVLQVTGSETDAPEDLAAHPWIDVDFKCKPGRVDKRPCVVAPYQLRIDWQVWGPFMLTGKQVPPWFVRLSAKLLAHDDTDPVFSLLPANATGPFSNANRPRRIRAELYRYRFRPISDILWGSGVWWERERLSGYMPALSAEHPSMKTIIDEDASKKE